MSGLRVLISGPLDRGDLCHNINAAVRAFRTLADAGLSPLCPHLLAFSNGARRSSRMREGMDGTRHDGDVYAVAEAPPADDLLSVTLPWVAVADAVLRLPGESKGADREEWEATLRGVPVFTDVETLLKWAARQTAEAA